VGARRRHGRRADPRRGGVADPALAEAAARHRDELSSSLTQARRWEFLLSRAIAALPAVTLGLALLLGWLALRAARGISSGLAAPIRELAEWAARVGRGEPLPAVAVSRADDADEFGALREAFRHMDAELAESRRRELEAERARTWVAMARRVAHELKNPLTPMRLAVHALRRGGSALDGPRAEAVEVIAAEADRLDEMARAFAQFGRLPEGPPSDVDLPEMLDYLLRTHLPPAVDRRLVAEPGLPLVRGHHEALSRAFANLILNAGEAVGEAGGEVVVEARRSGPAAVEVLVTDSGPGISADPPDRIWEPDFSTRTRGTGLGLALVRQTVQAHGGSATARNRAVGGAEFRVLLPLHDDAHPADEHPLRPERVPSTRAEADPVGGAPVLAARNPDAPPAGSR